MLRRLLLRFLLRRSLAARDVASHFHLDDERLAVIGTDFADDAVLRQRKSASLRELLQRGLVIVKQQILFINRANVLAERFLDELSRGIDAAVEIDRRDQRLKKIRQQRILFSSAGLLFAGTEPDALTHPVVACV